MFCFFPIEKKTPINPKRKVPFWLILKIPAPAEVKEFKPTNFRIFLMEEEMINPLIDVFLKQNLQTMGDICPSIYQNLKLPITIKLVVFFLISKKTNT